MVDTNLCGALADFQDLLNLPAAWVAMQVDFSTGELMTLVWDEASPGSTPPLAYRLFVGLVRNFRSSVLTPAIDCHFRGSHQPEYMLVPVFL